MSLIAAFPAVYTSDPDPYVPPVPQYDSEYDYEIGVEKHIGKWIDGSELYQTTIEVLSSSLTSNLNTITKVAHNISNISRPINAKRVTTNVATNKMAKWPLPVQTSSTANTSQYHIYFERFTKTDVWLRRGTNTTEQDRIFIAFQYTKGV